MLLLITSNPVSIRGHLLTCVHFVLPTIVTHAPHLVTMSTHAHYVQFDCCCLILPPPHVATVYCHYIATFNLCGSVPAGLCSFCLPCDHCRQLALHWWRRKTATSFVIPLLVVVVQTKFCGRFNVHIFLLPSVGPNCLMVTVGGPAYCNVMNHNL